MGCSAAIRTDEYHGWECEVTGGACMFLLPDSKACANMFGEGPDADDFDNEDDDHDIDEDNNNNNAENAVNEWW